MSENRYDMNASVNGFGGGSDGAYSLILRGATPEELVAELLATLKEGFGLTNCPADESFYLTLHIGPAGCADSLPI